MFFSFIQAFHTPQSSSPLMLRNVVPGGISLEQHQMILFQVIGRYTGQSSIKEAVEMRNPTVVMTLNRPCLKLIRYVKDYIQFIMQGRQEVKRRKEDTSALVLQEWELVLAGKPADKLNEYIYEYEMDLLTNSLESNPGFIEKYTYGLLLTGDYLELSFFLSRTKEVPGKAKLARIAEAGKCEKLRELGAAINEYSADIKDEKLKVRVKESTLSAILKTLTKYFLNYKFSDLKGLFNVSEEEVRQLGYNIQNGYIELKKEEVHSDCLLTKLRELAVVAHKMNKFE